MSLLRQNSRAHLQRALAESRGRLCATEARLHALHEELAEQRRLVAMVAHDLRSPLQTINVALSLLEVDASPGMLKPLRLSTASLARASALITELLSVTSHAYVTQPALRRQRVDLNELAARAVEEARLRDAQRELSLSTAAHPVWIDVCVAQVAQVLDNLISNALFHSPAGSAVAVDVTADGSFATLEVHNLGGIEARVRERLFSAMNRGESSTQPGSMGLGLYIVKRIVEAHQGTVEAVCEVERTCLRIALPLA